MRGSGKAQSHIEPTGNSSGLTFDREGPANLAFGGGDYKTLLVTARTGLHSVRVNVAGIRP